MTSGFDKKTFATIIHILRFITPLALVVLGHQFSTFEDALKENTQAVYAMRTDLAVMKKDQEYTIQSVRENKDSIGLLNSDDNSTKRDIQGLSLRFAALERGH